MQKLFVGLLIMIVSLGYVSRTIADLPQDILGCYSIQDNTDRLNCYDMLSKQFETQPNTAHATPPIKITPPVVDVTTQIKTTVTKTSKPESQPMDESATEEFGQIKNDKKLQSIQSRIVGKFSGWKKGLKITLENGQVWKVVNNSKGYRKMTSPTITISRGVFNSFNAKVEGLTATAKVKRVK